MNAGTTSPGITIGRLDVRWRVDAELREADRARLDGLVRELCDGPLEDALTDTPGSHPAEVCIRRLVVPTHRVRWDSADAELISGWATAIGRAVHATTVPDGNVVRFASRAHAQADLIASVLTGDRERIWAWQLLGLWPAGNWPDAEAVSRTVAAAVGERPGALVALVIAAARTGQLGRFTEYLGPAALAEFTGRAWLAAGGGMRPRPQAAGQRSAGDALLVGRLVALLNHRSEIIASALRLPRPAGRSGPLVWFRARPPPPGRPPPRRASASAPGRTPSASRRRQPPLRVSRRVPVIGPVGPAGRVAGRARGARGRAGDGGAPGRVDGGLRDSARTAAPLRQTSPRPQSAITGASYPQSARSPGATHRARVAQSPGPDAETTDVEAHAPTLVDDGAAPIPPSAAPPRSGAACSSCCRSSQSSVSRRP